MSKIRNKEYLGLKPGSCISRFDPSASECKECMIASICKAKTIEIRKHDNDAVEKKINEEKIGTKKNEVSSEFICEVCKKGFKTKNSLRAHKAHCGGKRMANKSAFAKKKAYDYLIKRLTHRFDSLVEEKKSSGIMHNFEYNGEKKCIIMTKLPEYKLKVVIPSEEFIIELINMTDAKSVAAKIIKDCGIKPRRRKKRKE